MELRLNTKMLLACIQNKGKETQTVYSFYYFFLCTLPPYRMTKAFTSNLRRQPW